MLARADACADAGDHAGAEAILRADLARGREPLVLAALAGLRARHRDPAAEVLAREAIALDASCGLAHRHLAIALVQRGALAEAVDAAARGAALDPDDAEAHEVHALASTLAGAPHAAMDAFARVGALQPERAQPWLNVGIIAASIGDLERAVDAHEGALARDPELRRALDGLAGALARLGRHGDAAAAWRRVLRIAPDDPDALHLAAALGGDGAAAPPPGYVRGLFDAHAATFDRHLADLDYQGPALVRAAIADGAPYRRALDLGCGTGLGGVAMRDVCGHLTGVDVAARMLAEAEARGTYDALELRDVVEYLRGGDARFDLIAATDVLSYLGELSPLFAAIGARLAAGGRFAMTVERGAPPGYALERSGRWSHSAPYVADLAAAHGLAIARCTHGRLRNEETGPIEALVFVLVHAP